MFNDSVGFYLHQKHGYSTRVRYLPAYLKGKEIDVFAEKNVDPKYITICECKLRLSGSPISMDEIEYFEEKISVIRAEERRRGNVKFHFWFVTNIEDVEKDALEHAYDVGIKLKRAILPYNWEQRSEWSVIELKDWGS
jgi:hypothetical protein